MSEQDRLSDSELENVAGGGLIKNVIKKAKKTGNKIADTGKKAGKDAANAGKDVKDAIY